MDDPTPIRIVLAEDQAIIRQGLRYIIDAQPDMTVVGESADGHAPALRPSKMFDKDGQASYTVKSAIC
jgi:DNA-binding NarL/FixJ family response regulator